MRPYYISLVASKKNGDKTLIFGGAFSTLYYEDTLGPGFEEIEKTLSENLDEPNKKFLFKETILLTELEIQLLIEKTRALIVRNIQDIRKINVKGHGVKYNFDGEIIPLRHRPSYVKERNTAILINSYNLLRKAIENSLDFQVLKHDDIDKPFDNFEVRAIKKEDT